MTVNRNGLPISILGLMTGSSADGLDICLVNFSGKGYTPDFEIVESFEIPYPEDFQHYFSNPLELNDAEIAELDQQLGQWFAREIEELDLNFDLIASHGQTIKHEPPKFTLQIGDPKYMAEKFKCPVVYDFRSADLEFGGQGAPLIPIVDRFLLQEKELDILALNIGGIANLTVVPARRNPAPLIAWDTGPGNTLIDKAVRLYSEGKLAYDESGMLASQGQINDALQNFLLKHPFYQMSPPRSAGQEQFGQLYFDEIINCFPPQTPSDFKNLIFTLTLLTAQTIADSIRSLGPEYTPTKMFIGGGGAYNKTMVSLLKAHLPTLTIQDINSGGVNRSNKEAFGFAYLGYLRMSELTGNLPSVTGAREAVTLGRICEPKSV